MSGVGQSEDGVEAGTSGMMETTMMEGEEYYNPDDSGTWTQKEMAEDQLCRICAKPNQYLIPIFEGEGIEHQLVPKIQKHLPIEVSETDDLPLQVCYQCASTLIAWNDLVIACIEADKKLRQIQEQEEEDDKGVEIFDEPIHDSDDGEEPDQPSTSIGTIVTDIPSDTTLHPKRSPGKAKKPKLKMTLVKSPMAGPSGLKSPVKKLTATKPQDSAVQEASERCEDLSVDTNTKLNSVESKSSSLLSTLAQSLAEQRASELLIGSRKGGVLPFLDNSIKVKVHKLNTSSCIVGTSGRVGDFTCVLLKKSIDPDALDEGLDLEHEETQEPLTDPLLANTDHIKDVKKPFTFSCKSCLVDNISMNELSGHFQCTLVVKESQAWLVASSNVCTTSTEKKMIHECGKCGKMCDKRASLISHLKEHVTSGHHSQALCESQKSELKPVAVGYPCLDEAQLKQQEFKCGYCGKLLKSQLRLKLHEETHSSALKEKLKCDKCTKEFTSQARLDLHLQVHNLLCVICGKYFKSLSSLKFHEKLHKFKTQPKKHMCHVCGKGFYLPRGLKNHLASHRGLKEFICETCGMAFNRQHYLTIHRSVHSDVRPYVCDLCGATFKRRNYLNYHLECVHDFKISPPVDPCEVCGKTFKWKRNKVEHMRLHTGERPLKCPHCEKTFRTKNCLFTHKKNIHGEGTGIGHSLSCDQCDKVCSTKGFLYQHKIRMHGSDSNVLIESLFACDQCGKTYTSKLSLYQHTRNVHLADKSLTYPCKFCDKIFPNKPSIYAHVRTHNEDRPFSCTICKKTFKTASSHSVHVASHSDVKPFACTFCEKRFRRKYLLEVHTRSHTGEKPYSCEICFKVFSQAGDRNRHRVKVHNFCSGRPLQLGTHAVD